MILFHSSFSNPYYRLLQEVCAEAGYKKKKLQLQGGKVPATGRKSSSYTVQFMFHDVKYTFRVVRHTFRDVKYTSHAVKHKIHGEEGTFLSYGANKKRGKGGNSSPSG